MLAARKSPVLKGNFGSALASLSLARRESEMLAQHSIGRTVMPKPVVSIQDWSVVRKGAYVAYEPLRPGTVLTGRVFGHNRLPDAKPIYTSPIVSIDAESKVVETGNTRYLLGRVSDHYKQSQEYAITERECAFVAA